MSQLCYAVNDMEEEQNDAVSSVQEDGIPTVYRNARSFNDQREKDGSLTESLLPSHLPSSPRDTM